MKEQTIKLIQPLMMGLMLLGCGYCLGKTQTTQLAVVDSQKLILQTAEGIARQNTNPEQAKIQIIKFKENLQRSLKAFAHKNNLLIVPSQSLFGDVSDQTENFITFYNEETS